MKLAIVDYGMGNIKSLTSSLKYLGVEEVILSNNYEELMGADKLILPGVGSFAKAMSKIIDSKLDDKLHKIVVLEKKPILGICLGMQLLCNFSSEDGLNNGLAFINASVTKFEENYIKIPHVGFNQVEINSNSKLFKQISNNSDFYFTHSYKVTSNINLNSSFCNYGNNFIAAFEIDNIIGTQFHPELSQQNGLKVLKNFLNINQC
jgi:glutamine amidotransferase